MASPIVLNEVPESFRIISIDCWLPLRARAILRGS